MKKKITYAVFTTTESGLDYLVQGNFGDNLQLAENWRTEHRKDKSSISFNGVFPNRYPRGLFVKKITY